LTQRALNLLIKTRVACIMAVSLQKSKLRKVEYIALDNSTKVGWFHCFVVRKGDYVGYSKGAMVEAANGKLIIVKVGEFRFVDPPVRKHRRLIFVNDKGATEVAFFHVWIRRKGVYVGIDTFALIEKKSGELLVRPYNEITFIDTESS